MSSLWLRDDLMIKPFLFLRDDLCKAKGGTTVGEEEDSPVGFPKVAHKPAAPSTKESFIPGAIHNVKSEAPTAPPPGMEVKTLSSPEVRKQKTWSTMRLKPSKAGDPSRAVRREEMSEAHQVWNKPAYSCKHCDALVVPPQHVKTSNFDEALAHMSRGGKLTGTHEGTHHVEHEPKMAGEVTGGHMVSFPHGTITPDHVQSKLCPGCYTKANKREVLSVGRGMSPEEAKGKAEAGVKKSLLLIESLFSLSKAEKIPDEDSEDFGKPAATVSEEISHLIKEKDYPQDRAVAAALSMQRAGKIKKDKASKSLTLYLSL